MIIVGGGGWEHAEDMVGLRFPIPGDNPNTRVVEERKPMIIADTHQTTPSYPPFQQPQNQHIRSWLGAPLLIHGEVIGMLALDSVQAGFFSPKHLELVSAFANQVAVAMENAQLFEEVQRLAITDDITGVHNRRHIFSRGSQEFQRSRRNHHPLTAIMLDIDKFKSINDQFGHSAGDQVLCILAQGCRDLMREYDEFGRSGGEEFLMVLPETTLEEALQVAERLRRYVEEAPLPAALEDHEVTVSLGVAERTEAVHSFQDLVERADQAMYLAKERGRNQVAGWPEVGNKEQTPSI
jgi:diguanylate cyclase (GGDEF)-like protein